MRHCRIAPDPAEEAYRTPQTPIKGPSNGATENASTENVSTGDGIRKYGKLKYHWQRWKMQVWKTQVQICRGGKRKYGNGKSDLNPEVTEKYLCQSTE